MTLQENKWYNTFTPELHKILCKKLYKKVEKSIEIIKTALKKYRLPAVSFNGGKDSIVFLHLIRYVLHMENKSLNDIVVFHFKTENSFKEIDDFIEETSKLFNFRIVDIDAKLGFKDGLKHLLKMYPEIDCVFLGTRRADPHGANLNFFEKTSEGWPELMRVSPILEWDYEDVWNFIRTLEIPYSSLYDRGYTSIGSVLDTIPNKALKTKNGEYLPAYELKDGTLERAGRLVKKHLKNGV